MLNKKLFNGLVVSVFMLSITACNSGRNKLPPADTGKTSSGIDSMPIVTPPVKDSSSVIITPPTGDSNIVKPDTNNNRK